MRVSDASARARSEPASTVRAARTLVYDGAPLFAAAPYCSTPPLSTRRASAPPSLPFFKRSRAQYTGRSLSLSLSRVYTYTSPIYHPRFAPFLHARSLSSLSLSLSRFFCDTRGAARRDRRRRTVNETPPRAVSGARTRRKAQAENNVYISEDIYRRRNKRERKEKERKKRRGQQCPVNRSLRAAAAGSEK